jgi:hypothetical protein
MSFQKSTISAAAATGERSPADVLNRRGSFSPRGRNAFDRWQEEVRRTFQLARTALSQSTPPVRQWPPV